LGKSIKKCCAAITALKFKYKSDNMNFKKPYLFQIALSVTDLSRTIDFYKRMFELDDSGYIRAFRGRDAERVQGIKGIASTAHWLQEGRREFQLEFFQFEYPPVHPKPKDYRPCDIGITRIAFHVRNLDETLERGRAIGVSVATEPAPIHGQRHAIIKDPDENMLELIEFPENLPYKRKAQVAGVAMSVPDLSLSLRTFTEAFGLPRYKNPFAAPDSLWNLTDAKRDTAFLDGGCAWIEISEYHSPTPKPWREGHLLTDIGLSHLAFTTQSMKTYDEMFQRSVKAGFRPNSPDPFKTGRLGAAMYCEDPQGFMIELAYLHRLVHGVYGLAKPGFLSRFVQRSMDRQALKRYPS
jgi:catechol 2,3-dioxygenase-like lactoylglutathione lyase family enzyme